MLYQIATGEEPGRQSKPGSINQVNIIFNYDQFPVFNSDEGKKLKAIIENLCASNPADRIDLQQAAVQAGVLECKPVMTKLSPAERIEFIEQGRRSEDIVDRSMREAAYQEILNDKAGQPGALLEEFKAALSVKDVFYATTVRKAMTDPADIQAANEIQRQHRAQESDKISKVQVRKAASDPTPVRSPQDQAPFPGIDLRTSQDSPVQTRARSNVDTSERIGEQAKWSRHTREAATGEPSHPTVKMGVKKVDTPEKPKDENVSDNPVSPRFK